ncbi:hypothetical protein [Paludibaculum fermentans]|uniref:Secreted protein n=1 Tax=Paludibaculum fermentans TaxID=1473598 RepID=A0A7S7NQR1_PALFE|nr:hypothetical protein [Paludibaculum fermentans]QOY88047.1 hypothetical protein IRI77_35820 [Paludibaculum fermentans]
MVVRFVQAALFAAFLGGASLSVAPAFAPEGLQDSLLAAIRGSCRPAEGSSSFHNPQRQELRLERSRSTAAQPFAAGLPTRRADHTPLPENAGACGHFQSNRLLGGLFTTRPARAPPSFLS